VTERRSLEGPIAAGILALLGFLPLVLWIGRDIQYEEFSNQLAGWISGTAVVLGVALVLAILARSIPALWPAERAQAVGRWVEAGRVPVAGAVALLALIAYAFVAFQIFNGRPIVIDEIAQLMQAQIFAQGRLWMPAPAHPEFFSSLQMVTAHGRIFSQYPPGGPAMLTPFTMLGVAWLTGPVAGAVSVLAFAWLLGAAEPDGRIAAGALVLYAFAPFVMFMSGSYMNCVTALTCLLVGAAALANGLASGVSRPALGFVAGLGFGVAATIRPVDALAFALPAAIWYLMVAVRNPARWRDALAAAAGIVPPVAFMLFVNAHTTGAPFLFGYDLLWGHGHELGFHRAPSGELHTPLRGLALINAYVLRLQRYLFETPIPSLLPAIVALALSRAWRAVDRYLAASAALLMGLYLAYWHDGFYLGPRFMFALAPVLALWTARCAPLVWTRLRAMPNATVGTFLGRVTVYALVASAAIAIVIDIPARATEYAHEENVERWATPQVASRSGVPKGALVFVVESWEAQLVVRMWALGVRAADVEQIYRDVDICRLDEAVSALEARRDAGEPTADPTAVLEGLTDDSVRVKPMMLSPGANLRVDQSYPYPRWCGARIAESMEGVLPLAPFLVLNDGNVYARDLHARDTLLLRAYPTRPVYALRTADASIHALPMFVPVSRDSLRRAWNAAR
jgi:hypothetical protein